MTALLANACVSAESPSDDGGTGSGGSNATGGATAGIGGARNTGGSPGTGGAGTGGAPGVGGRGGTPGTGGTPGIGGATGFGGAGTGGTRGTGGTPGTGGMLIGAGGRIGTGGAVGTGGAPGTGGATGVGGSTGTTTAICNFASGLNVAWINFARDVPNPNVASFQTLFKNTFAAGGRVVRWWFHTDGTTTPGYDSSGIAKPLQQSHVDGVKSILSAASAAGVRVNISLWSFDMLQASATANNIHTFNSMLLENDTNRQAYIDNYLTPLVKALKGTPGLYSYEIFNEPEGMGPKGWAMYRTTQAAIQKTVNWFAAAIHTADPTVLVTNGSQTFDYCSNISGKSNWYSDAALRAAGGKQNGTLDFYEVHYYTSNGTSNSAFLNAATHWGLDKKLVMGEFFAAATDGVAANDLYTNLYSGGYNGAWAWQYNDGSATVRWPTMQVPMQNVFNAHMADIAACQ
jgi:hypothetical protein